MYQLRDYQTYSVQTAIKELTKPKPKPVVLQLATGAGKSLIIADICHKMNQNILVLQPQKELVQQNYEKMMSYNPDFEVGIYCAALKRREVKQVTYATIQSIYKKPELFMDFDIVIIDECHQLDPKNVKGRYNVFLAAINCVRVLGLTATPYRLESRLDGAELKMINRIYPFFFKSIVCRVETQFLIDEGYLSPILYRSVDLGGYEQLQLNSNRSDYTAESLQQYWLDDIRLLKLTKVIQKIDEKCQRSLIFCSSLDQADRARQMLSDMGIRAEMVDGSTPQTERTRLVSEYRAGKFKHMLNVGVFTTGFDVPELDCVVLARPTISLALYYQMVGRGVRLDPARPDKKLRVYDLVRLVDKLGRVETIKVQKEDGGWKDEVVTEKGVMTNVPMSTYA